MAGAKTAEPMSTELLKVAERAKREPAAKFTTLAHLIDEAALRRAYQRLSSRAAVGVDGITKEQYGQNLEENLRGLHERMKTKRYRHQPLRRVHIPKEKGGTRPIGISALEDKIVQGAVKEVLEAVYEQDFRDCSYGFRPGRGAHDAMSPGATAAPRRAPLGRSRPRARSDSARRSSGTRWARGTRRSPCSRASRWR